jgi:hypothetical protein
LKSTKKKNCSLLHFLHIHILFENFQVRKGIVKANSKSGQFEFGFKNKNQHCIWAHRSSSSGLYPQRQPDHEHAFLPLSPRTKPSMRSAAIGARAERWR